MKRYSTDTVSISGIIFDDRLIAPVSVSVDAGDFSIGVVRPSGFSAELSNVDAEIVRLRNSINGLVGRGVSIGEVISGFGKRFVSFSSGYTRVNKTAVLDLGASTNSMTLELAFKKDATAVGTIFAFADSNTSFGVEVYNASANDISANVKNTAGTNHVISSGTGISGGIVYHVVLTVGGGSMSLYYGKYGEMLLPVSTIAFSGVMSTNFDITFPSRGGGNMWQGWLYFVRLWNTVVPISEIYSNTIGAVDTNDTRLVGYWSLDETSGITAIDLTRNKNNGIITGSYTRGRDFSIRRSEVNRFSGGIVNSVNLALTSRLNITQAGLDLLSVNLPLWRVTVDDFPNAIDTGAIIPYVIGTAKKVPLALVKAFDDVSGSQYQYVVGYGDITVDVVYRDGLVIKEYSGIAQGGTVNSITLSASDTRRDDFYNLAFVEITGGTGVGQVRKIIDYDSTTKIATVSENWVTIPDNTSQYRIREWKKITWSINGQTFTGIEFAISQRDRDRLYDRDRVSADVTGLQPERNPAFAIRSIIELLGGQVDSDAFTKAGSDINSIGGLFVDGAIVDERMALDVIDEISKIGRLRVMVSDSGVYTVSVAGLQDSAVGIFSSKDSIINFGLTDSGLDSSIGSLVVKYRRQFDSSNYRLTTQMRAVSQTSKSLEELEFDFIFDKTTADKVADYLSKLRRNLDSVLSLELSTEGRMLRIGDSVALDIPELRIFGIWDIIGMEKGGGKYSFSLVENDPMVYRYVAGRLPSDPVTDARADFSKTPPDSVQNLQLSWTLVQSSYTATANLTWTVPTENYKSCIVQYKKSGDTLYTDFGNLTGTSVSIHGLTPGLTYDFRITSVNFFDLQGGVITLLNQLAPGDSTAPATPTGLTGSGKFGILTWTWNENTEEDISHYRYRIWDSPSGGTLVKSGRTTDTKVEFQAQAGDLTTTVTRYLEVRAVDLSGNASSFTSRVSATSTSILQGDIQPQAVHKIASASNTGTTTTSPVISLTFPNATNRPIWIEFSGFMRGSAGLILSLAVNGTIVYQDAATTAFGPSPITAKAKVANPGSGNLLIEVYAGNIPAAGISNRNLVVYEAKNA